MRTQGLLAALLLVAAPALAGGQAIASLTPSRLPLGEVAQLTLEIDRNDLGTVHIEPRFKLDNLQIVGGPAQQTSMTWVNGRLSRRFAMTWYLAPLRQGRARVTGIQLVFDGKPMPLPDQEAWIDAAASGGASGAPGAGAGTPAPAPGDEDQGGGVGADASRQGVDPFQLMLPDLFRRATPAERYAEPQILLRAEITPANPWTGQQLVSTLYLLAERRPLGEGRVSVESIFPRRVPAFRGFWSQEIQLPESGRAEIVQLGDRLWWRQPILQRALFPYEPGPHHIESAQADLRLVYFRPLAFGMGEEPIRPGTLRRDSNALEVDARALPPAPPGFTGAVGQLDLTTQLGQPHVRAGEGVVLTERLQGTGNLSGLADPPLPVLPGVEVSAPQELTDQKVVGTRVESTRSWVWTLVPTRAGQWRLPARRWVVFDPTAGKYTTIEAPELSLVAGPPSAPPPVPTAGRRHHARQRRTWQDSLLWASAGAGGALLAVALGWLVMRLRSRDPRARRRLLAEVQAALGEAQPRHAAGAAEEAWRSFLGDRFALPPETPAAQWPRLLASRGLQPRLAGELVRLVDDLHYLRYAPQLASTDALQRELYERSRRLVRRLA